MNNTCFWMIRRKDTGEYYRNTRGPSWAKCGNWTTRELGKAYGKLGNARLACRSFISDNLLSRQLKVELVRFRVVEDGTDSLKEGIGLNVG